MRISNSDWQISAFFNFAKRLLKAYWRSLLLLLVGVGLPLLVFEELAIVVWQNAGSFPWDEPVLFAIHTTARSDLDAFVTILTRLGVYWGVLPAAIVMALRLLYLRRWRSLVYWAIVLLGSTFLNRTAKAFWQRSRPSLWDLVVPERDFSFPSGHAMSSMTFVVALLVLTWGTRWFGLVLSLGGLFVVSIAWTRLYLGVHFPSDILAGWMVSIAWAVGLSLLIRPHLTPSPTVPETTLTPREEESIAQG